MGIKECKVAALTLLALVLSCTNCKAATIIDLYDKFDAECTVDCPEFVTKTISQYQRAEKYNYMYKYINASNYDPVVLERRVSDLKNKLKDLEKHLLNACNLDRDTIYSLESEYLTCKEELSKAEESLINYSIEYHVPDIGEIPTRQEYEYALQLKNYCNPYQDIGNINDLAFPVQGDALISDITDSSVTLRTPKNTLVTALFNGTVLDCDEHSVTIFCGSDVYVYEGHLDKVIVDKGDAVAQGDVIGKTSHDVLIKLKLGGKLCDVQKLFNEGG